LDASNLDRAYRRNAVRRDVLPVLEQYNPRIAAALARSAQSLALDADYLDLEARRSLDAARRPSPPGVLVLDRQELASLHAGLRAHVLRRAVETIAGSLDGVRMEHIASLGALVTTTRALECRSLPHGLVAQADGDTLVLRGSAASSFPASDVRPMPTTLPVPGETHYGRWTIRAERLSAVERVEPPVPDAPGLSVLLDDRTLDPPLLVRGRLPGDRIRPKGLQGRRKVQDILVDAKVARRARDFVPVVADQTGIFWLVGHAQDARTFAGPRAPVLVRLTAHYDES
jgi:tRNA(Ile)-lysidine synthase